jgi:hypothetical protein
MNLADWQKFADSMQAFATTFAIGMGGYWTLMLFRQKRQKYPRAEVTHAVTARNIEVAQKCLLRIEVTVKNAGDILLEIAQYSILLEKLLPAEIAFADDLNNALMSETKEGWEVVDFERIWHFKAPTSSWSSNKALEIEPNERHQFVHYIIVDSGFYAVFLHSSFKNKIKAKERRDLGWKLSTEHDILTDS